MSHPINDAELKGLDEKKADGTHGNVHVPIYNNLELASEVDLSFGAIIRGTAAKPMNTFEKKAALINLELDKFGMGRYQCCTYHQPQQRT